MNANFAFLQAIKARQDLQSVVLGQIPDGTITDDKLAVDGVKSLVPNSSIYAGLAKEAGAVLYLDARMADRFNLPLNDPLTTPWVDLSGLKNDATPTNMAGTTSSGVDTTDPSKPFWVLDGSDDFFGLVNTTSVDVTSAPLAVFATIKANSTGGAGYVVCKNASASTDIQYGLLYSTSSQNISAYLEGASKKNTASSSVAYNTWVNIGFIWDGSNVTAYINQSASGSAAAFSGTLTSRANMRIGRRETTAGYFKGDIATVSIYAGAKATAANILKAEKAISAAYLAV